MSSVVFPAKASSITTSPPIPGWTLISFISSIVRPGGNGFLAFVLCARKKVSLIGLVGEEA